MVVAEVRFAVQLALDSAFTMAGIRSPIKFDSIFGSASTANGHEDLFLMCR